MDDASMIDDLWYIENRIYDLVHSFGSQADGLENDAVLVISLVQELRFKIEELSGI